jgi:hypothetical protein
MNKLIVTPQGVMSVPMTAEEIETRQAEEAIVPEPTLQERLAAIYNSLHPQARGAFLPLKSAVWKELEGQEPDLEAVQALITSTVVPEELESVKAALLAQLPQPPQEDP